MTNNIEKRIEELGLTIPEISAPAANYVPFVKTGNQVFISGQISAPIFGKLGDNITIEEGQEAARKCALNIIAVLKNACDGDLSKVARCVKLGIFINAIPGFTDHPIVGNGASDLIVDVFGNKGKHARFAMGAGSLPKGVAVEIDAIFEVE